MSNETIEQMQARLAQYDAEAARAATNTELDRAIAATGIALRPGTTEQVRTLLGGDVRRFSDGQQTIVAGPNGRPLADHLKERFAGDLSHFVAPAEAPRPEPLRSPTTQTGQAQIAAGLRAVMGHAMPGVAPVTKGGELGSQIVSQATQQAGDPTHNMGLPFGLKPRAC